jgi:hypothetical protein
MSISAMKQALEALEYYRSAEDYQPTPASEAITALRQAIAEAEKQEPLVNRLDWWALIHENQRLRAELKFNTSPPKREWVGLNIEDYAEVKPDNERAFILGARWAEAKLKEKST